MESNENSNGNKNSSKITSDLPGSQDGNASGIEIHQTHGSLESLRMRRSTDNLGEEEKDETTSNKPGPKVTKMKTSLVQKLQKLQK